MIEKDILIVGAGPVGIFAGFQCGMCKLSFCVLEHASILGGQCMQLYPEKYIYDIPAYPKINGRDLINNLIAQASIFNPEYYLNHAINNITFEQECLIVHTNHEIFKVKSIILAAGMGKFTPVRPNIITNCEANIHYTVTRKEDFQDLHVTIFGGGDSAVDWALELSSVSKHVCIVHRSKQFRAIPSKIDRLYQEIEVITHEQIKSFVDNIITLQNTSFYSDKIIFCFGQKPDLSNLLGLKINVVNSKIPVSNIYMTNIQNIYAIGDVAEYENKIPYISVGFAEAVTLVNYLRRKIYNQNFSIQHSTTIFENITTV